ncbi:methionine--tRNA ligase, partial [Candidatus Woesearchaeota archaeon]|nr:methionine--tRNA ligase [Candidatus Woesearchaeota archaeon]
MAEENKVLVTSALPYANGSIHVGHLVEYIQTDVFVRFLKLIGKKAIYCCADDTHGAPIEINARKQGIKPEQLIAKYFTEHQRDFKNFLIEFDNYYTTNSPENKKYSDLIFTRLKEKGYIYQKDVEQTYCEHCKRFLPDRYVKGKCPKCGAEDQYGDVCEKCNSAYKTTDLVEPYCTICSNPPVRKTSKHYFFKLSDFSEKLRKYITGNKNLQEEVKNHVLKWVNDGLEDWCISRDGPYFGFLIPGETDKYYYVWLDAPIGYIASAQNYCDKHNENVDDYWKNGEIIHFIGKDIIYFHLLFWPAMLMGAEFTLPSNIVVHGFLTVNKEKMSKSRGTLFTAEEFLDIAEPELLRFYYAANLTHSLSDIDLDLHDFAERVNSELVSNIANFFYRVLSFANKNFDSKLSTVEDEAFVKQTLPYFDKIKEYYQTFEFREAVKAILQVSSLGNKYFQDNEPWKLIKDDREKAHKVITLCANLVKNINISLKPIMPAFTKKIE